MYILQKQLKQVYFWGQVVHLRPYILTLIVRLWKDSFDRESFIAYWLVEFFFLMIKMALTTLLTCIYLLISWCWYKIKSIEIFGGPVSNGRVITNIVRLLEYLIMLGFTLLILWDFHDIFVIVLFISIFIWDTFLKVQVNF